MVSYPKRSNYQMNNLNYYSKKKRSSGNVGVCFWQQCDEIYDDIKEKPEKDIGTSKKEKNINNLHNNTFFPNKFYVLEKKDLKFLRSKKELIDIKEFSDKNNNTYQIPSNYDKESNRYYITKGTFNQNKKLLRKQSIKTESFKINASKNNKNTSRLLTIFNDQELLEIENGNYQQNLNSIRQVNCSSGKEQYKKEVDELPQMDLDSLTINHKIATAYNSANILYNPYQYLPWLYMFNEGKKSILISDEVGLGKTIEAGILIVEELHSKQAGKIIIVCPAFLRNKWRQELKDKFFLDSSIYNEQENDTDVLIVPLSRLKIFNENNDRDYNMVIVDEAHYFKNDKSARYKYLFDFIKENKPNRKVFMSATPINNTENDFRSIQKLLGNDYAKTSTTKKQAYIDIQQRNIHEVYIDLKSNEQSVYDVTNKLNPFSGTIYRHIGASCLYALKKYAEKYANNESDVKTELRNSLEELLNSDYDDTDEIESFNDNLSRIPLSVEDSKLKRLKNLIDEIEDKKIVIFSHYIETVKYLKSELDTKYNCEYIYGNNFSSHTVYIDKKNRFVDAKEWFHKQNSNDKTILICSDSCKEGIDLDEASCLINYDLPFNPSILEQRIGRIDRMCQKQDMNIYNFHVNQTYDDRLHMILSYKLLIIDYYAEYGIGNPLSIVENGVGPFDKFILYFKKNKFPMTNDDLSVIKKILKKINIQVKKNVTQDELLKLLLKNKDNIIKLFDDNEIKDLTDEQLYYQKQKLDKILGFPKHESGKLYINETVKENICMWINNNPIFKSKLSCIIIDYEKKLKKVEDTGNPMHLDKDDIMSTIDFNSNIESESNFISAEVISILENQGAEIYAIK